MRRIKKVPLFYFYEKSVKKSSFGGPGGSAQNPRKNGPKHTFFLLYRRKIGQKVVKKWFFQGVGRDRQNGLPRQFFTNFCGFIKNSLHRAILIVRAYADAFQIFKIMESTTKLVTAHAESIFRFGFGFLKTWGALVELEWLGRKTHFMCGGPLWFPFMELYSNRN